MKGVFMSKSYASFKNSKWFPLIIGVLSVLLGIICISQPSIRMESIALIAGIVFLLYGLLQIVSGIRIKDNNALRISSIILGAILVVLAILDFVNLELIGKYLPALAGFFMVICAVTGLISAFTLMRSGLKSWWVSAIPAFILLVFGIIFIVLPGTVGKAFGIFAGISLLINGLSNIISFIQMKK